MPASKWARLWAQHKELVLELFVLSNVGFLILDIYFAHSANGFRHPGEWIPFWFSIAATVAVAATCWLRFKGRLGGAYRFIGFAVGYAAIFVGIWGMVFHLDSQFFQLWTLKSLVYTAPCIAPLSYAGLGFLLLINRMVDPATREWGQWVTFMALGGFVGNLVLTLADHAQNGFFHVTEWIPVVSAAFAVGFLLLAVTDRQSRFLALCLVVLALQMVVGVLGFFLHLAADVNGLSSSLFENLVHGAPIFAPMLFADLFMLGAIGIVDGMLRMESHAEAEAPGPAVSPIGEV